MKIYVLFDDIAKKPVELFLAVSEEEATLKIENQLEALKKKYNKFKYRINLYYVGEYNEKLLKLTKIYKSKG